jgi:hypothetical protein
MDDSLSLYLAIIKVFSAASVCSSGAGERKIISSAVQKGYTSNHHNNI